MVFKCTFGVLIDCELIMMFSFRLCCLCRWTEHILMSPMEGTPTAFQVICNLTPGYHQVTIELKLVIYCFCLIVELFFYYWTCVGCVNCYVVWIVWPDCFIIWWMWVSFKDGLMFERIVFGVVAFDVCKQIKYFGLMLVSLWSVFVLIFGVYHLYLFWIVYY